MSKLNPLLFLMWVVVLSIDVVLLVDDDPTNDPWPFLVGLHVFLVAIYGLLAVATLVDKD